MSSLDTTPITDAMRARMRELGVGALERFDTFGAADRRCSVLAVCLAGAAPLAGVLLLGWDGIDGLFALYLNLLVTLVDDAVKIVRAAGRRAEVARECIEDDYVWTLARAISSGERVVYTQYLPSEESLARPGGVGGAVWLMVSLALVTCAMAGILMFGEGSMLARAGHAVYGVVPNALLLLGTGMFQHFNRGPQWRHAASARLQTTLDTALMLFALGFGSFLALTLRHGPDDRQLAIVSCVAVIFFGLVFLTKLQGLRGDADWLRVTLGQFRPETRRARA